MRFAQVTPRGDVIVYDMEPPALGEFIVNGGFTSFMEGSGLTVWYDPDASGGFNWQAQRLLRDRLMPEDRICGDVLVAGPMDPLSPEPLPDEALQVLEERHEQHTH